MVLGMSLEGKVALVTGGGRGIGESIVDVLASLGMAVAVSDLRAEAAQSVAKELAERGIRSIAAPCDVASKSQVEAMMDKVERELGPLWLLVNNAGVFHAAPTAELAEEQWDQDFAVDAKGVFLCSQAAIRRMMPRRAGRIVNISSIAGWIVRTGQIGYCSAKAATIHFSRCLAVEMAPHGITVNCVCPGMTDTEMLRKSTAERGLSMDAYVPMVPAGRLAKGEDHARMVAFLAGEEAGHVTGQVITVDGCQSLNMPLVR